MSNLNGVTFTSWSTNISKHSYTDFGVILTEQNIGLPSPKIYSVSIEGMDGSLDLSECFGEMKYENRTLKFTFESIEKITDWQAKMINISSFLHGHKMKIKTWSDPNFIMLVDVRLMNIIQVVSSEKSLFLAIVSLSSIKIT